MGGPGGPRALSLLRTAGRMAAWRAHAYAPGGAELRLEAARVPALRASDHVLVRVHAASINPLDVAMLDGYGSRVLNVLRSAEGAEGVEFPLVTGRDFVGVVERAGPEARVRAGERVWGVVPPHMPGSHADYVLVKDQWVGPAPESLNDAQAGGALYAGLSACAALRAGGLRGCAGGGCEGRGGGARGARVLLLGLGGVGHAALQLLVADGAQVVVGCAGAQAALARALGAAAALDRHAPGYHRSLEDEGPYDVIVDCAGLGGEEAGARRWRFGRYVTLTTPLLRETDARGLLPGAAVAVGQLLAQSAGAARTLSGPGRVRWAYFAPREADIRDLRRLADQGRLCVQVERVYAWWEGVAALERAARGGARGKLLLDFTRAEPEGLPAVPARTDPAPPTPHEDLIAKH